ncbi:hypothetical protein ZEAMMB73_Zm00001d034786 [Zea mays]|uniref:Uncharacterized protein n=1 Tax=Zea mays TaxID=4577 RepID=A0A1D6LBC8_MAIZE|nr:hypothetical protein ZEAMMB73_Zm00001d034786 [Zea mays]
MIQLIKAWKDVFSRTNVIVFPNYIWPHSEAFQVDSFIAKSYHEDVKISLHVKINFIAKSYHEYVIEWLTQISMSTTTALQ